MDFRFLDKSQVTALEMLSNQLMKLLELRKKKAELEVKNKAIIDSIDYARKIQYSILPDLNEIKKHLPKLFLCYNPKDIIGGDFYWFYKDLATMFSSSSPVAFCTFIDFRAVFSYLIQFVLFCVKMSLPTPSDSCNLLEDEQRGKPLKNTSRWRLSALQKDRSSHIFS